MDIIQDLAILLGSGAISKNQYDKIVSSITDWQHTGFFGRYYLILLIGVVFAGILYALKKIYDDCNSGMLKEPKKAKESYFVWAWSGIFGGHYLCVGKFRFLAWVTTISTFLYLIYYYRTIVWLFHSPDVLFISDWNYFSLPTLRFYYIFQACLLLLFSINFISGLVLIPYWTYVFNFNYFRKNRENDDILNGKSIPVDRFYNDQLIPNIKKGEERIENVLDILNNEEYIIKHPDDKKLNGVMKNILTFGGASSLAKKMGRLRAINKCAVDVRAILTMIQNDNNKLQYFLKYYRIAAYRNLYLAKELINIIRDNIGSKKQEVVTDYNIEVTNPDDLKESDVSVKYENVKFDSKGFFNDLNASLSTSLNNISTMGQNRKLTKGDLKMEAVMVSVDVAISAIGKVISLNSRISAEKLRVQNEISTKIDDIRKAIESIEDYYAILWRESEIMLSLSKCNKAFIHAYEPLREMVFGKYPSFKQYMSGVSRNQALFKSEDFKKQIHHLILVSSDYNKVNSSKL